MLIEIDKYYKARNGEKVKIVYLTVIEDNNVGVVCGAYDGAVLRYKKNGEVNYSNSTEYDLIEEWK